MTSDPPSGALIWGTCHVAQERRHRRSAITEFGPYDGGRPPIVPHLRPAISRLWDTLSRGRRSEHTLRSGRPVRLLDAPVGIADATRRWLHGPPTGADRLGVGYHSVVGDQVRELAIALHSTAQGLTGVVDLMLTTTPQATADGDGNDAGDRTVSIDLYRVPPGTRAAAEIVATIDHLAAVGDSPALAMPVGARGLVAWIADEIDIQTDGRSPTAYTTDRPVPLPPCPVLRVAISHGLAQATIHAYRHAGFTTRQTSAIRASRVAATLTAHPGATLDELLSRLPTPRLDLLAQLGDLIELRAVFGIDRHWYPYDITVLAHRDAGASRPGCTCATASG